MNNISLQPLEDQNYHFDEEGAYPETVAATSPVSTQPHVIEARNAVNNIFVVYYNFWRQAHQDIRRVERHGTLRQLNAIVNHYSAENLNQLMRAYQTALQHFGGQERQAT